MRTITLRISAVFILAHLLVASCSTVVRVPTQWQAVPVEVDLPQTWADAHDFDKKSKLYHHFSNDDENLYILLLTDDETTQIKMLRAGMELSIDTLGKSKGHCTIIYPVKQEMSFAGGMAGRPPGSPYRRQDAQGRRVAPQADERGAMIRHLMGLQTHAIVMGFNDHREGRTAARNPDGIQVSLDLDSAGMMAYRAVIPLRTFYRNGSGGFATDRVFGLEVRINGIEMPQRPAAGMPGGRNLPGGSSGPAVTGGGGRGMPGGGRGQGMASPAGSDMQTMSKPQIFKAQLQLQLP